jgi:hypothetical protein
LATLVINHNAAPAVSSSVDLSGTGIGTAPVAAVSLTSLAFGSVSDTQAITVKNTGNADLIISGVTVTGVNAASFSASIGTCGTVVSNGTCSVSVSFQPTIGAKTATLIIAHNAAGSSTNIPLSGSGLSSGTVIVTGANTGIGARTGINTVPNTLPTKPAKLTMPTNLDFGTLKVKTSHTVSVTVTNRRKIEFPVTFVDTLGGGFTVTRGNCPISLDVGRSCKLRVTFRPTVSGKTYSGVLKLWSSILKEPMTMSLTGKGKR